MPATAAQIEANRTNAHFSTGPRTPEGKARSSQNATKLGLFTMHDFVLPAQQAEYDELCEAMWLQLYPEGTLQEALVTEIIRATWRLNRCGIVESNMIARALETGLDPMEDDAAIRTQIAVDRARLQSNSIIRRNTAELRRLQTNCQITRETMPGIDTSEHGVATQVEVLEALNVLDRGKLIVRKVKKLDSLEAMLAATLRPAPQPAPVAEAASMKTD